MTELHTPLMMSREDFARLHGVSVSTVKECIAGASKNYPLLRAKKVGKGKQTRYYITAEAAAEWREAFKDV